MVKQLFSERGRRNIFLRYFNIKIYLSYGDIDDDGQEEDNPWYHGVGVGVGVVGVGLLTSLQSCVS